MFMVIVFQIVAWCQNNPWAIVGVRQPIQAFLELLECMRVKWDIQLDISALIGEKVQ